jgi:hypothetical protein
MAVAPEYGASPVVSATYIAQPAPRLCFAYDGSGNMTKVAPCP